MILLVFWSESVLLTRWQWCCQEDELSSTAETVQKLNEQIAELEEQITAAQRDRDQAQAECQRQQTLSEESMSEVKDVLQALEELALNYEQKTQEVLSKDKDNEALSEELTRKKVTVLYCAADVLHGIGWLLCKIVIVDYSGCGILVQQVCPLPIHFPVVHRSLTYVKQMFFRVFCDQRK